MSNQSPQRSRRSQAHPSTQASMQTLPPRETSPPPSLRDRPRALKAVSMPLVPSVMQMFANSNPGQSASQTQQLSPTTSNPSRRSPPAPTSQAPRLLPTPPLPNPTNAQDPTPERRANSPPPAQHTHSQPNATAHPTHYPRPINRVPPPHFLHKFHGMDENWQMTDELLAEIERADLQQSQGQSHPVPSYLPGYDHVESGNLSKDPPVERVRSNERSSPKDVDGGQQRRQREQQAPRESPNTRDRQPTSPTTSSFPQGQPHTPDRRVSPPYHTPLGSPGENSTTSYSPYKRDSPPVLRRGSNAPNPESRSSLSNQTPPVQTITARSPDRSLPVQEEAEDDIAFASKNDSNRDRDTWKAAAQHGHPEHEQRLNSPTSSSDLHPDGHVARYDANHNHSGRGSRAGRREDDDDTLIEEEAEKHRSLDRERPDDEGGYTPRSPTAGLPDDAHDRYYPTQNVDGRTQMRGRARTGPTDHLGLRGFDPAVFDQSGKITTMGVPDPRAPECPPQYAEQRGPVPKGQQQPQQQQQQQQQYQHHPQHFNDGRASNHYRPQLHPEDLQSFLDDPTSAYIHAFLRPDAPVPPTPHTQTAAPSPSPLISGMYSDTGARDLPPFSPGRPIGSPYPYPFSHVRRNQSYSNHPNRPPLPSTYDPNHPTVIQEQLAKQWQVYAQNNHGHLSDSTFSPSSTPFQGGGYNPWASLHTNRILGGRMHDPTSLQSSPSHEPVALPPPPTIGLKKKDRYTNLRTKTSIRKPPPRVDSTQPRETSPEPSSSGEETAGEETFAIVEEGNWVNGTNDNGDWVDEDDEPDDEDLLELEFHPSFVSNVEKRRRRWETRWEALNQAFQALDRQTDATLVLLAAPSHSTKLHLVTSRSIRRNPLLGKSPAMSNLRAGFRLIASQRRNTRPQKSSLVERLLQPSGSSADGSDGSAESREEDLNRLLGNVLGGLEALGSIYEQREARWIDEMRRISEDRERVEFLLRQIIGEGQVHTPVGQAL